MIDTASWFSALGAFENAGEFVAVSPGEWRQLAEQGLEGEFRGAALDSQLLVKEWLPTSLFQKEPVVAGKVGGLETDEARKMRLEIHKLTQESLRSAFRHELLRVGPTDYWEAARGAALYAFRMAATEAAVNVSGFWCSVVPIYHRGHWPFAILESGAVATL